MAEILFVLMGLVFLGVVGLIAAGMVATKFASSTLKWGYVDAGGSWVVPARFDEAGPFSQGLAAVKTGQRWGYVDASGNEVIPPKFKEAGPFSADGVAWAREATVGKVGYIDRSGAWTIKPTYDKGTPMVDGRARVAMRVGVQTTTTSGSVSRPIFGWGLIDDTGAWVVENRGKDDPERWTNTQPGPDGRVAVKVDGKWGFVDASGAFVVAPQFDDVLPPSDGLVPVKQGDAWGYVDPEGAWVIEPSFARAGAMVDGLAPVSVADGWTFVSRDGALWDERYERTQAFVNGRAVVKRDGWRVVDADGVLHGDAWAKTAGALRDRLAVARIEGEGLATEYKWGLVDGEGRVSSQAWFDEVDEKGFVEGRLAVRAKPPR